MSTAIMGFKPIIASIDSPIDMLGACHEKVRKQCSTLRAMSRHLAAHGSDAQAQAAAGAVMRYFDEAAQHHHADEEIDLLPRLLESAPLSERQRIHGISALIVQEHEKLGSLWQELRTHLIEIRAGHLVPVEPLQTCVDSFTKAYESHTEFEDSQLIPLAKKFLDQSALQSVSSHMKARRGLV